MLKFRDESDIFQSSGTKVSNESKLRDEKCIFPYLLFNLIMIMGICIIFNTGLILRFDSLCVSKHM